VTQCPTYRCARNEDYSPDCGHDGRGHVGGVCDRGVCEHIGSELPWLALPDNTFRNSPRWQPEHVSADKSYSPACPGDAIAFSYDAVREGEVVIARTTAEEYDDPVRAKFLQFLAHDMEQHPERIRPIPASLVKRARALTKRVKIDLDAPLDDE
jgi:hypothetical protein